MKQYGIVGLCAGLVSVSIGVSCAQGTTDSIGDDGSGGSVTGQGGATNVTIGSTTSSTSTSTNGSTTSSTTTSSTTTSSTTASTTSSTTAATTAATTGSGSSCDPTFEFDCGDGSCTFIFYVCDGIVDCNNGADEAAALCGTSSSSGVMGWTCDPTYYDAGDGCDCGCGVVDLDCLDATPASCDYCGETGSCTASSTCPSNLDPTDNSSCI